MFEFDSGLNWDQLSSINSLKIFNMGYPTLNKQYFIIITFSTTIQDIIMIPIF